MTVFYVLILAAGVVLFFVNLGSISRARTTLRAFIAAFGALAAALAIIGSLVGLTGLSG